MEIHLAEVIEQLLEATRVDGIRAGSSRLENPITHFSITPSDVKEAMEKVSGRSASGLDGIPSRMIKQIGDIGDEIFDTITKGVINIPAEWAEGRKT